MPIKEFVVFDEFVNYSGPFELKELYLTMDHFFKNHHYDKKENKHYEKRTEDERYIELILEPHKTVSESVKYNLNLVIVIRNLKDIEVNMEGKKRKVQQADVTIRFRAFIATVYPSFYDTWPIVFLLRTLVDKYIYKTQLGQYKDELAADAQQLKQNLKAFFNLYQVR